jgi:hypothetical protein
MNGSKTVIMKTTVNPAQNVAEKVIAGKKYVVRTICVGNSNKNVREAILQLAERKTVREMGL